LGGVEAVRRTASRTLKRRIPVTSDVQRNGTTQSFAPSQPPTARSASIRKTAVPIVEEALTDVLEAAIAEEAVTLLD
jgi:hypothetical protein